MRQYIPAAALSVAIAALLGACDQAPEETAGGGTAPAVDAIAPAGERPTPDPNAIVWALSEPPITLDPARAAVDPGGFQVAAQVYDRLFTLQRDRPFHLAAGVAEDWDVDASGRTYTFTIREGLTFHDGTPLDAPAVKWNFERWMNPDHPQHIGDFRAWRSMFGGSTEDEDEAGRTPNLVERVESLDARTVRVTLIAPFAPFLNHLAMPPFSLASPTAVEAQGELYGSDAAHLPVGSGPFSVIEWRPESGEVTLAAFTNHLPGPPAAPGLRFVTVPEVSERISAVAEGLVHAAELAPTETMSLTQAIAPSIRVVPRPARSNAWLMLNHERTPLNDPRVRQAFALAIDRERLAEAHFGAGALGSDQILVPGMVGYDPEIVTRAQDVEAAKVLLAEAGVADGFALNISVATTPRPYLPDPVGTGNAVAEMLRGIGIAAEVQTDTLRRLLTRRATGRTTAWIIGWELQSSDPDNAWYYHFGPSRVASEGRYDNRLLFDTLLEAQRTVGSDARATIYQDAARMVRADDPRIFLAASRSILLVSPQLTGFSPGGMGFDDLTTVVLGPDLEMPATVAPDAPALRTVDPGGMPPGAPGVGAEEGDPEAAETADPGATETAQPDPDDEAAGSEVMTAAPLATGTAVSPW